MMLIKPGVDISRLTRPCRRLLNPIDRAFPDCVITSTYEGTHCPSSLHYANRAFDLRLVYPVKWAEIDPVKLNELTGPQFDVLREATHFHIEYEGGR